MTVETSTCILYALYHIRIKRLLKAMSSKSDDDVLHGINNPNISHVLHPVTIRHLAREWLKEDTPNFDYGGFVVGEREETAVLLMKSPGVLAGRPFFDAIFKELECTVTWNDISEGSYVESVKAIATVSGKVRQILLGERVALNIISRASGIASAARRLRTIAKDLGWKGEVAGTRKTTPGFRLVEKYALLVGGVSTHRYDLSSMIMLKDNHIWSAGSICQVPECMRITPFPPLRTATLVFILKSLRTASSDFHNSNLFGTPRYSLYVRVE